MGMHGGDEKNGRLRKQLARYRQYGYHDGAHRGRAAAKGGGACRTGSADGLMRVPLCLRRVATLRNGSFVPPAAPPVDAAV